MPGNRDEPKGPCELCSQSPEASDGQKGLPVQNPTQVVKQRRVSAALER